MSHPFHSYNVCVSAESDDLVFSLLTKETIEELDKCNDNSSAELTYVFLPIFTISLLGGCLPAVVRTFSCVGYLQMCLDWADGLVIYPLLCSSTCTIIYTCMLSIYIRPHHLYCICILIFYLCRFAKENKMNPTQTSILFSLFKNTLDKLIG